MRVIYNDLIPPSSFKYLNFCGLLFCRKGTKLVPHDYNHEAIHTAQMKELWYIGFCIIYVFEWLFRFVQCGFDSHAAYRKLKFEEEAYKHQYNYDYLKTRKKFAQWR